MKTAEEYLNKNGLEREYNNIEITFQGMVDHLAMFLYEQTLIKNNSILINVDNYPDELEPVLAKIEHINDLGKSKWYEVVYYDGKWHSYSGSKTFKDGEKVVEWKYCKDELNKLTNKT